MNFGEAIHHAKSGGRFIRKSFCNRTIGWGEDPYISLNQEYKKFYMHDGNRLYEWMPSMADILADDYICMDVPNKD